jgi:polar amino acid transport system substrate-binding protein
MRNISGLIVFALLFGAFSGIAWAEEPVRIRVIAPEFSPLQMMVDGKPKGYVVELAEKVIARVSNKYPVSASRVRILPWKRVLNLAQEKANVMLFSISRTSQRENKFQWVGTVSPYEIYFFKLRRRSDIRVKSMSQLLQSGYRVGVGAKSNTESYLREMGFREGRDFVTYSHYTKGIKMLFGGRFTMLPLTSFVAHANVCRLGFSDLPPLVIPPSLRVLEPLDMPPFRVRVLCDFSGLPGPRGPAR